MRLAEGAAQAARAERSRDSRCGDSAKPGAVGRSAMTQLELVRDLITKLDLPEPLKRQLRERHKLR